jgi:hypothetical protein
VLENAEQHDVRRYTAMTPWTGRTETGSGSWNFSFSLCLYVKAVTIYPGRSTDDLVILYAERASHEHLHSRAHSIKTIRTGIAKPRLTAGGGRCR